jgi:uncharacterized membrane protein YjjP (DUF1212 family)
MNEMKENKTPLFIRIISVLSIFYSGIGVIIGLNYLGFYIKLLKQIEKGIYYAEKYTGKYGEELIHEIDKIENFSLYLYMGLLLGAGISVLASFVLFVGRKIGFYIFIFAKIIPISVFIYLNFNQLESNLLIEGFQFFVAFFHLTVALIFTLLFASCYSKLR